MALIHCSSLFFLVNNANEDMASLVSFPLSCSASSEVCGRVYCLGVKNNNDNYSTNSSLQEGFPLREYKSLQELTSKEVSDLKENCKFHYTQQWQYQLHVTLYRWWTFLFNWWYIVILQMTQHLKWQLQHWIFNGLESLGCTKFLSKSKLPASIRLGTFYSFKYWHNYKHGNSSVGISSKRTGRGRVD